MSALLRLSQVHKRYRKREGTIHVLAGASLQVESGELVVVCGPSGCGKTTLLFAAGGLLAPDDGRVLLDGRDTYSLSLEERAGLRAGMIGFVFQQFHLIPYLSVLENVMAPSLAVAAKDAKARAWELIEHFHLSHRALHVPAELSTGERQRTAMARALLNRPKLLLADEPTGNLDPENASTVLSHIAEFAGSGGAVLLVTHDDVAKDHAHRVLRLEGGKLAPRDHAR
jgi:ABC-type lipoprotein export system ATPase subunit